jgi:hypothetical protein
MGSDRIKYSEQSKAKISLREQEGVKTEDIYIVWSEYNRLKDQGVDAKDRVSSLRSLSNISIENVFNYFLVLGIEMINAEIIKRR